MNSAAIRWISVLLLATLPWLAMDVAAQPPAPDSPSACDSVCSWRMAPLREGTLIYRRTWSFDERGALATDVIPVSSDTYVLSSYDSVLGDLGILKVGADRQVGTQIALAQIDIGTIPRGAMILSATLEAHVLACPRCTSTVVSVHRVTRPWSQDKATWASVARAIDKRAYAMRRVDPGEDRWVSWNVTELVRAWYHASLANDGLALRGWETRPDPAQVRSFSSREAGLPWSARLVVTWRPRPPEPFSEYP